jgi:hypothetical protein
MRPALLLAGLSALSLASCAHAAGRAVDGRPTPRLVQKLVEREHAISLYSGHQIDQANIFSGFEAPAFKVASVRCTPLPESRFDCRFTLTRSIGSDSSTDTEKRVAWKLPEGGWTTDIIEALCAAQRDALGTTECVGIVDE